MMYSQNETLYRNENEQTTAIHMSIKKSQKH